jgi:single-strand selective monofunctional uracil DNA glycosylase
MDVVQELIEAADELSQELSGLTFAEPVTHVYNPLAYARVNYVAYVEAFAPGPKQALFLGMNPGPWGMAQTGVPFGDPRVVREWLRITNPVQRPDPEHPKRPVQGVDCPRSEISGTRLWGAVREHFGTPQRFFDRFFIGNYCPLSFMEGSGRNRIPEKLPKEEREVLFALCDRHLRRVAGALRPRFVIGIGAFAAARAKVVLEGLDITVGQVLHPSPASPAANTGWDRKVRTSLRELGLCPPSPAVDGAGGARRDA